MSEQINIADYSLPAERVPVYDPEQLSPERTAQLKAQISRQLEARQAVLIAHYYVDADVQDLAEESGGCVADSLEMARFGRGHGAQNLVVAGVRLLGEAAKSLSPDQRVVLPWPDSAYAPHLGCPPGVV